MFAASTKINKHTIPALRSIKITSQNNYIPFYYQRDHLGRLLKDKDKYN